MREQAASAERRSAEANQTAEILQLRIDVILAEQNSTAEEASENARRTTVAAETMAEPKSRTEPAELADASGSTPAPPP